MVDADLTQLVFMAMAAISVMVVVSLLIWPMLSGEKVTEKRILSAAENRGGRMARRVEDDTQNNRRKEVSEKLKELEDRQKSKEKVSLRLRLQRSGLDVSPKLYWIISIVAGLVIGGGVFVAFPGVHILASVLAGFVGIFGLPRFILGRVTKRRQSKFTNEFVNAIDVIVRGVKTGLPLTECLGIIARESAEPVRSEFQDLVEQQRVGIPLTEAFDRMMKRMPLPEVKFFSIVIGIQSKTGGNLSEALGNLSGVLRARKMMAAKVAALSSEAKASAGILAALPFSVMAMVYISTPDYMSLLWTTKMGQFLMLIGAIWMLLGVLMMKKMINFKY